MRDPIPLVFAVFIFFFCLCYSGYGIYCWVKKKKPLAFVSGLMTLGFFLLGCGSLLSFVYNKPHHYEYHDGILGWSGVILILAAFLVAVVKKL